MSLRGTAPTGLLQRGSCQFRSRRAAVSFAFQQTFIRHVPEQELLLITNCILRNNSIHKQVDSSGPTKQNAITPTREQNCLTWISVFLKRKILKEKEVINSLPGHIWCFLCPKSKLDPFLPTHSHLGNKSGGEKMEKSIASPLQRPAVFHYYQTPILRYFSPPVFSKKDDDIPANRKKWTINLWESQKAKNYKHSKLALPARQQQLETQFQRKFREIIFTKNFVKISRPHKIYVWVSKDDVRSCSTEFFKTEKEKEGRGGNEIFWWTPFLSQFPKAHLEFHAYVSRKKAPKYAFFHHRLKQ